MKRLSGRSAAPCAVVVVLAIVATGCGTTGQGTASAAASPSGTATTPSPPSPSASPSPAALREGRLPAGRYTFQPFAGPGALGLCGGRPGCTESPADDSIRLTLTLPDGWSGAAGTIVPAAESYLPPGGAGLNVSRGGWVWSKPCRGPAEPWIQSGTAVSDFVTVLVDHPDLDVTSPADVTLGGYSGQYLELHVPPNISSNPASPGPGECGAYFVWEPGIYAQGPNALWRIWVLDVDGIRLVIRTDSFPGTSAQVRGELQAIVDSIQIEP